MKAILIVLLVLIYVGNCDWEITFSDEFDQPYIDPDKWTIANYTSHCCPQEQQIYMSDDAYIENGTLVLRTQKRAVVKDGKTFEYTSGWVDTGGHFSQFQGKLEMKAKLPKTGYNNPIWPAFWTLPDGCDACPKGQQCNTCTKYHWPIQGEIDVLESFNVLTPPIIAGTYHWGYEAGKDKCYPVCSTIYLKKKLDWDDYHIFTLEWNNSTMIWSIDGIKYKTLKNNKWGPIVPYKVTFPTVPHYIIINDAIRPWTTPNPSQYPKYYYIEYVKAYKWVDDGIEAKNEQSQ